MFFFLRWNLSGFFFLLAGEFVGFFFSSGWRICLRLCSVSVHGVRGGFGGDGVGV